MARPRMYEDPEIMEKEINGYFDSLMNEEGKYERPPTISGLTVWLGFCDRQSLQDYCKDDRFSFLIKRSRMIVESYHEERMAGNSPTGSIFWLKNHAGYTDKQEQTIQGGEKPVTVKIEYV